MRHVWQDDAGVELGGYEHVAPAGDIGPALVTLQPSSTCMLASPSLFHSSSLSEAEKESHLSLKR